MPSYMVGTRLTRLLSSFPERVSHQLRLGSTGNGDSLAIRGDIDTAELVHVDLDTTGHFPWGGDRSVGAIISQGRQFLLVGEFHLCSDIGRLLLRHSDALAVPRRVDHVREKRGISRRKNKKSKERKMDRSTRYRKPKPTVSTTSFSVLGTMTMFMVGMSRLDQ